jgi:hypothetical protein
MGEVVAVNIVQEMTLDSGDKTYTVEFYPDQKFAPGLSGRS